MLSKGHEHRHSGESEVPSCGELDAVPALLAEGYDFIGRRCRNLGSDIFVCRLLGRRTYFVRGEAGARMFYHPGRFTRRGAMPKSTLKLLQDEGSVATLDDQAHRRRKDMFLSLMPPERLGAMADLATEAFRGRIDAWRGRSVTLHDEYRAMLCRAVTAWAGFPDDPARDRALAQQSGAMIDYAGSMGPLNWLARLRRLPAERTMRRLVEDVRAGRHTPPPQCALHVIAWHRDDDDKLIDYDVAAVELLNIVRPTVAVARFMTFAALALHQHPACRARLADDDGFVTAFVHEVRRFYPFFPFVAGVARLPFEWHGHRFAAGARFVLDLYGTNHDERLWPEPDRFRPERFLGWHGDAFTLVPQGGGDHATSHRCPGEWLTIAVMRAMLGMLARDVTYDVPDQDLSIDLAQVPALPRSGFVISNARHVSAPAAHGGRRHAGSDRSSA